MRIASIVVGLCAGVLFACSSDPAASADAGEPGSAAPDGGSDTQTPDAGAASADAGAPDAGPAGPCNDIEQVALKVQAQHLAAFPMPNPIGGTLRDGVYQRVSTIYYDGTDGADAHAYKETIRVSGRTVQSVLQVDAEPEQRATFELTLDGTSVIVTQTCPVVRADPDIDGYSATGSLKLLSSGLRRVITYQQL